MMEQGAIVTYRDFGRKLASSCGIVEGVVQDNPNIVIVRWVGSLCQCEEPVAELEEI